MVRNSKLLLPAIIVLVGIVIAWLLLLTSPKAKRESTVSLPPLVKFIEIQPQDVRIPVFTQGTVKPRTSINLSAEVTGRIVEVSPEFSNGSFFKKDDVLLRINPSDYQLAITKAEALVASAKQQLARGEAEYKQKVAEYKGVSRGKVSDYALRKPQYEEAKAKLKSARADLGLAKVQLERCNIRAPFDGRVVSKKADVGQYVMPGMVMAEVYSTDVAEVRLPLSQRQINLLDLPSNAGSPAELKTSEELVKVTLSGKAAGQLQSWTSELIRTEAVIDERNRLQYVVAQVKDPYGLHPDSERRPVLNTGLFVEAKIEGRLLKNVYVLPRLAIHNNNTVRVLDKKRRLSIRRVSLIHRGEELAYVKQEMNLTGSKSEGISSGERVIVSPLDAVVEGMQLRIEAPITAPTLVDK